MSPSVERHVAASEPKLSGSDFLFLRGPGERAGARTTTEEVLALRPGMPADSVMKRLGPPLSVIALPDESALDYSAWRLTFTAAGLRDRVHFPPDEPEISLAAFDRRLRMLARRIRRLRPGSSIETVKARLGQPEEVKVYGSSLGRDVGLWYGEWRLVFDGARFEGAYRSG